MEMLIILAMTFVPTILIELAVLVYLRERRAMVLCSSVVINIITNVSLNLCLLHIGYTYLTVLSGELAVVLVEALWYYLFLRVPSQAIVYSVLCNAISFLTGLLLPLVFVVI